MKNMKRNPCIIIILAITTICLAQSKTEKMVIKEWLGTLGTTTATQYVGEATVNELTGTEPSQDAAVWRITKKTYSAAGLPLSESVARSASGDNYGVSWTNRTAASYNTKP